jgi:hypothetical protein
MQLFIKIKRYKAKKIASVLAILIFPEKSNAGVLNGPLFFRVPIIIEIVQ